jgi:uncharacterized membrane protein
MFSDLIFGLSLSISAITLIGSPTYSQASIVNKIISFVFNFIILIMIWIRYTGTMAILPVETGQIIFLNLLMLLLVGLEPYLLSIIQGALFVVNPTDLNLGMADYASSLYAMDLAGLVAIQGFFTHILSKEEKGLIPSELLHKYRVGRNGQFVLSAIFAFSVLPQFWTTSVFGLQIGLPLRIQFWWIPLFGSVILIVRKYGLGVPAKEASNTS